MKLTDEEIELVLKYKPSSNWFGRRFKKIDDFSSLEYDDTLLIKTVKTVKDKPLYYGRKTTTFHNETEYTIFLRKLLKKIPSERNEHYEDGSKFQLSVGIFDITDKDLKTIKKELEKRKRAEQELRLKKKKEAKEKARIEREQEEQRKREQEEQVRIESERLAEEERLNNERRSKTISITVGMYEDILGEIEVLQAKIENLEYRG